MSNGNYQETHERILKSGLAAFSGRGVREGEPAQDLQGCRRDHRGVLQAFQRQGGALLGAGRAAGEHDSQSLRPRREARFRRYDEGKPVTPEQVRAALEAKAAGTLATTAMLYSHRDIYELLVFRSYGTPYEHFLDWLVDEEDRTTLRVLELIHGAEKARTVISKESLHIVNHAFYSALSENIIHAKSVEELNATTEVISTFFNAGWEKYRTL